MTTFQEGELCKEHGKLMCDKCTIKIGDVYYPKPEKKMKPSERIYEIQQKLQEGNNSPSFLYAHVIRAIVDFLDEQQDAYQKGYEDGRQALIDNKNE